MNHVKDRLATTRRAAVWLPLATLITIACESAPSRAPMLEAQEGLSTAELAGLVARISEAGGYFDTDNLISNEAGYLNVIDALDALGLEGGAYVGVGPDQSFSYIAELRPAVAFIVDVRRDNMLHHLLLKALIERSPTRVELLSALHGVHAPPDPDGWRERDVEEVVAWVDSAWSASAARPDDSGARFDRVGPLQDSLAASIVEYGIPLSDADLTTIRRFHRAFVDAGPGLRFTSFGRPPRPYYPTYRQLVLETDVDGDRASYLATRDRYEIVRNLQLANRIVPVVGDLAGPDALREMGEVMREMGVGLTAFYASNVEFYLWRSETFERWIDNLRALPVVEGAVVIRSYFPNLRAGHPSSVRGYHATQTLQPVSTLLAGGFDSYWEVVTRDVLPLR